MTAYGGKGRCAYHSNPDPNDRGACVRSGCPRCAQLDPSKAFMCAECFGDPEKHLTDPNLGEAEQQAERDQLLSAIDHAPQIFSAGSVEACLKCNASTRGWRCRKCEVRVLCVSCVCAVRLSRK